MATAIGRTPTQTSRLLDRTGLALAHAHFTVGRRTPLYDRRVIDALHALLGQPHRPLEGREADWLSRYLQGDA